jgi:hypothetical protein
MTRRNVVEMVSWRSARCAGGVLALSSLWWTVPRNPRTSGLFFWAALCALLFWLVRDRDD